MKTRTLLLIAAFGLGAFAVGCPEPDPVDPPTRDGGTRPDGGGTPDGGGNGNPDGGTDGGTTFAAFVIDLIQNQTAENTEAVSIPENLVDTEDPAAFDPLFAGP